MKENNIPEEIDLVSIFTSIRKGISNLFHSTGNLISFSMRNIKTILLFSFVGVSISIGLFFIKKTTYMSELTLSHTRLNNNECYALINTLTDLRDNSNANNDKILAEKLNINVEIARQIKSVSCKALNESLEKSYKDSAFVLLPFKIVVKIYDPSILDTVQKGILGFLESNEYSTKRKNTHKNYLDRYEEKIKSEIIAIDSLKRLVDKSIIPRINGNGIILGEPIDPVKVYQAGMELYRAQLNVHQQKEFNNSFEIMIGFSPAIPSTNLLVFIITGFSISSILGVIWAFRRAKNQNL